MFTWYKDYKRRRARGDTLRPLWQIPLMVPLALLYFPARWYVDWMDNS
jgi:hypothetical protein